jgi:uncharacterized protein with HEPN domain
MTNKDLIEYVLGSIEYLRDWTSNISLSDFENDLKTQDAVYFRLNQINYATSKISSDFKEKYSEFNWGFFHLATMPENECDVVWDNIHGYEHLNDSYEGLLDYYDDLEKYYLNEFFPEKLKTYRDKEVKFTRDYKYPIVTNKSIWTVKKR